MSLITQTQDELDVAPITLDEAVRFISAEAELLDKLAYRDWLTLWADDGHYVIPINRDGGDPTASLNIVYDDKDMREARVKRLLSGFSMSSAPPARTVRTLSRFVEKDNVPGRLALNAAQILVEYKYGRTRILAGDVTFRLIRVGAELKLQEKSILLLNSDDDLFGIGYLL